MQIAKTIGMIIFDFILMFLSGIVYSHCVR